MGPIINLGLSSGDKLLFEATLKQSHRIRVQVRIHDRNEKIIHTFSNSLLSGAVQVDASQAGTIGPNTGEPPTGPVRTLELMVLQPRRDPAWLPEAPGEESVFVDNFISVLYGVWVDGLSTGSGWVDVPVFWGPITGLDRDGDQVTINAAGKEVLGMDPALMWVPLTIAPKTLRTTGIRRMLEEIGETRFDFPTINDRIVNNWSLDRHAQAWLKAIHMARSGSLQLFYDGNGRARLRPFSNNRQWLFTEGADGTVLTKPKISYDISELRNVVEVLGPEPTGKATRIRAVAQPPTTHPLSVWSLARNGEPRRLIHVEEADVNSTAAAQALANALLDKFLTATVDVELETLVIPHLEEGDRVAVMSNGAQIEFSLHKFTIPLVADEAMTVGVNRRVSWRRRRKGAYMYRWAV